jgi:hypothetical protein
MVQTLHGTEIPRQPSNIHSMVCSTSRRIFLPRMLLQNKNELEVNNISCEYFTGDIFL